MTPSSNFEYCLLHYVPTVLSEKSVSIAAIVFNPSDLENGTCMMIFAADWQTNVLGLDPDADLEALEALLTEISERLLSPSQRADVIRQLEDSFSNVVQISQRRKYPFVPSPEAIGAFACRLLEETTKITPGASAAVECEATLDPICRQPAA